MEDSLVRAVSALLNPQTAPEIKAEAQTFCEQVKNSPDGWRICASIFVQQSLSQVANTDPQTRFFALQTVEDFLRCKLPTQPSQHDLQQLQVVLWSFVTGNHQQQSQQSSQQSQPEISSPCLADDLPIYLRNKLAVVVTLVFAFLYPQHWAFFDDLIAFLATSCGGPREEIVTDFFLRIALAIDDEIVNQMVARNNLDLQHNTMIKDAMRESDTPKLASVFEKLLYAHSGVAIANNPTNDTQNGYKDLPNFAMQKRNPEFANVCLKLFAKYVVWIDINCVVTKSFVESLYSLLKTEEYREFACLCIIEIIGKGMKPEEKLALVKQINLIELLNMLMAQVQNNEDEVVPKLVNALGIEMCVAYFNSKDPDLCNNILSVIQFNANFLIGCLSIDNIDFATNVLPFLNEYLSVIKKAKKVGISNEMELHINQVLASLLRAIVMKMKFESDFSEDTILNSYGLGNGGTFGMVNSTTSSVAAGVDGTDVEDPFLELRKALKRPLDNIATINSDLFTEYISTEVCAIYKRIAEGGKAKVDWTEAELSLHLTYLFGECVKSKSGQLPFLVEGAALDSGLSPTILTAHGKMVYYMIQSNVCCYEHVSIPLSYFETIVRYGSFCDLFPDLIPPVLSAFVDSRGLHHTSVDVRYRLFYLFNKFVHAVKQKIGGLAKAVLSNIGDLLAVPLPTMEFVQSSFSSKLFVSGSSDSITPSESSEKTAVEAQLYLFEAVGAIISSDSLDTAEQTNYLTIALSPILGAMESDLKKSRQDVNGSTTSVTDPDELIRVFHMARLICVVGAVGKGFPDFEHAAKCHRTTSIPYIPVFSAALSVILSVLEKMNNHTVIRNAVRYTAQRLVGSMGQGLLAHIGPLINAGLLNNSGPTELIDLLPFIALLQHKFKSTIFPVLAEIIGPIFDCIFLALNSVASGTDEKIELISLRKSYLNLICQIFNSDMESVFIVEKMMPKLETIFMSILHFISDFSDQNVQKLASSALLKMINAWGGNTFTKEVNNVQPNSSQRTNSPRNSGSVPGSENESDDKHYTMGGKLTVKLSGDDEIALLPGFDAYIYERIVPLLFEIPLSKQFDVNDGQCIVLLNEFVAIHRALYLSQGERYLQFLAMNFFPNKIGLSDVNSIQLFLQNIQQYDTKQLRQKKSLLNLIIYLRGVAR